MRDPNRPQRQPRTSLSKAIKKNAVSIIIEESLPPPSRILDSINTTSNEAVNFIRKIDKNTLEAQVIPLFAERYKFESQSLGIEKLDSKKGINADWHFIITHDDGKKYHAKPALHGLESSAGSKFNEMAFYKLNENLKIGPKSNGFVTKEGILMICTEDLNFRSVGNRQGKTISFEDNRLESGGKREIVDAIPIRDRDSVHRCATEIAISLLFYGDVKRNYANTGFKITNNTIDPLETKAKPFVIDFKISDFEHLNQKYDDFITDESNLVKVYADIIASNLGNESERKEIPIDIFKFKDDPQIIKDALKKLFLTEDGDLGKFHEAISNAFDFAISLARESGMSDQDLTDNIKEINERKQKTIRNIEAFVENPIIMNFLQEEGRKIKVEKTLTVSSASFSASGSEVASASTSPINSESVVSEGKVGEGGSKSITV